MGPEFLTRIAMGTVVIWLCHWCTYNERTMPQREDLDICIIVCLEQDFELPGADFCLFPFGKGTGGNKDAIERTGRIQ